MVSHNPNVGVAFALVCGAGAATAIGASVVFFPALVKLASRRVLASALGLSAGVMTYVSFVEIFRKSVASFVDAGNSDDTAYRYATLCFFGGVLAMMIMDRAVKLLSGGHHHHHEHDPDTKRMEEGEEGDASSQCSSQVNFVTTPHCACCSEDPVGELNEWQRLAEREVEEAKESLDGTTVVLPTAAAADENAAAATCQEPTCSNPDCKNFSCKDDVESKDAESNQDDNLAASEDLKKAESERQEQHEHRKLVHMGINTALAIGLHNFPEGLATFVAALDDPNVGAVLAVAIGIHNIPEGLCVALPIYYATGNRCKAFLWACISGISEPIAALLGWAVLANRFSHTLYAILFGLVGGMMVIISTKELLPTAHRYDPEDTVVTYSFIGGMCVMALSLVLFTL